jgi:hypothetical protein
VNVCQPTHGKMSRIRRQLPLRTFLPFDALPIALEWSRSSPCRLGSGAQSGRHLIPKPKPSRNIQTMWCGFQTSNPTNFHLNSTYNLLLVPARATGELYPSPDHQETYKLSGVVFKPLKPKDFSFELICCWCFQRQLARYTQTQTIKKHTNCVVWFSNLSNQTIFSFEICI